MTPTYYLPQPIVDEERDRLNLQHKVLKMMLGNSLYPIAARDAVKHALKAEPGKTKTILDVGTGTGAWAVDMAFEFPHTSVLGIDITPDTRRPHPANCRFLVGNFDTGLPQYRGGFDVVHARCIGGGARNYPLVLDTLASCLRPGGVLLVGEGSGQCIWTGSNPKVKALPAGATDPSIPGRRFWTSRLYDEMTRKIPIKAPATERIAEFLYDNSRKSDLYKLDSIGAMRYHAPIGWPGLPEDNLINGPELGRMMAVNAETLFRGLCQVITASGVSQATVDSWLEKSIREMRQPDSHLYIAWDYGWATRRLR